MCTLERLVGQLPSAIFAAWTEPFPCAHGTCLMAREAPRIYLSFYENRELQRLTQAHSTPQALVFRARLVLRCAAGDQPTNDQVAADLRCDADTVSKWRRRFQQQ